MSTMARRKPVNSVDRVAFRDMCAAFAKREVAPRWEQADREKTFPRDFYVACAKAGLIFVGPDPETLDLFGDKTEPEAGNDIQNVRTSAQREGDEWVLDGLKSFITLAASADILITLAQTDRGQGRRGMQFFAVPRDTPGVVVTPIETYVNRPAPTCRVAFNQVRIPESARIPAGFREIMAGFNRERIMVAARWLGHMQHALDWARDYALTRHQFGRPIGANQSIAFQLANAHVDVDATRRLTYHAAEKWDSGCPVKDVILDVSTAKFFATQAVVRVTQTALHIGGGWGLTEELPIMRMALDALVAPVTVGSTEIQLRAIAKEMGLPVD